MSNKKLRITANKDNVKAYEAALKKDKVIFETKTNKERSIIFVTTDFDKVVSIEKLIGETQKKLDEAK